MLSVVVPVYNEEAVVKESYIRLTKVMQEIYEPYEIIFVNDGSRDKTLSLIHDIINTDLHVKLISFSRNFGHQVAITAGMDKAKGDAVIIIDADLQDPPEVIPEMVKKWREGYNVVYAKRLKRKGETRFKKFTAKLYYRFLRCMTSVDIPADTGDFRLIDRKVCNTMKSLGERNRFVRGLVSWVGFKQCAVEYDRDERFAGETKYPLKKMLKFASDGITSFSYKPLKLAVYIGAAISVLSLIYLLKVLIKTLFDVPVITGGGLVAIQLFFNGVILIFLGIIGEYIGRIYDECKGRPLYIIDETIGFDENENN